MSTIRRQKSIQWLNIFLLVINLSALFTLFFLNSSGGDELDQKYSSDEFLRKELKLTNTQYKEIQDLDSRVFRAYQILLDAQCEYNFKMVEELSSETPSKEVLDSLANRIGKMQASLKRFSVTHFLNIKSVCTHEQDEKLDVLLREMMEVEDQCKYCNKKTCERRDQNK